MNHALLIIDYQFDFVDPTGSLYVKDAEKLKPYIQDLIKKFKNENRLIIASMDNHPVDHYSFSIWPPHCITNTKGQELYISNKDINKIIEKGTQKEIESYSAFFDEKGNSNGLLEYLKSNKINKLTIVGVALDVCVKYTYNDAIKLGFETEIDLKGCASIK